MIIILSFFLFSCYEEYLLIINNESSYNVTFNLTTGYWTQNYNLEAGKQFTHSMNKNHSHTMNDFEPKDNVFLTNDVNTYTFNDIPPPDPIPDPEPIPASILNTLPKTVILNSNGAISTDPLTINANQEITTETIIKRELVFFAKTIEGYPVQVDYILDEDIYMIILR